MRFTCVVIFMVCVVKINAGNVWNKDLISPKGWDLGYGVALKLNESKKGKGVPIAERLSLELNFADIASVSVGKPKSDGVELDFYVNKDTNFLEEGRSKKNRGGQGKHMMQMMIGYKAALMASIMFTIMKILTMKAIFLAKAALIISLFLLLLKLKDSKSPEIIEVEQHGYPSQGLYYGGYGYHPSYEQQGSGGGYYGHFGYGREAQPSNVYHDVVYAPSATATEAESNVVYSAVMPNGSVIHAVNAARNGQETERRKDKSYYRKMKGTATRNNLLSIKKYASTET